MDRGALQATVHGVALSRTERPTFTFYSDESGGGEVLIIPGKSPSTPDTQYLPL